jgi:YVTN family beta-propeller protein
VANGSGGSEVESSAGAGGSGGSAGAEATSGVGDSATGAGAGEAWKQALIGRLASEPGSIYNAVGYEPNALSRFGAADNKRTAQWSVGWRLKWVAMKPDGSEVWCTPETWDMTKGVLDRPLAVIDPASGKVKATVSARHPGKIAFSPDGSRVYVTLVLDDAVAVYDSASRAEIARIPVGKHPLAISVSFDGARAYVTHGSAVVGKAHVTNLGKVKIATPKLEAGSEYLAIIDLEANAVVSRVELGGFSSGVAVSPNGSLVYATVSSVDPAAVGGGGKKTPTADGKPRWDGVAAISTADARVIKRMEFADKSGPSGVAFTPDGKKAYAICGASDSATPIDAVNHRLGKGIVLKLGG